MPISLAIHGGAGAIPRSTRPSEVTPTLHAALDDGMAVLRAGSPRCWEARHGLTTALSAAMAAVEVLEACPRFNAAVGSVLTTAGTAELEASVMEGRDGRSGAVTGVTMVKSPTRLAALVLATTPHVFLGGEGAATLAAAHRDELSWVGPAGNAEFVTPRRQEALRRALADGRAVPTIDHEGADAREEGRSDGVQSSAGSAAASATTGTVGAVALDADGHLAVATSTGGLTAKWPGRIGDTPVIGAGFYAADGVAAISGTGRGEALLTAATAVSVVRAVEYTGVSVATAADQVLGGMPAGTAGLVAVTPEGEVVLASNAAGMYCGGVDAAGRRRVRIWDEDL
ncbi:hypothetical protein MMPV_003486 [Pyropia vietnamensis]